ncbi:MAG: tetratricopeptide repeat protein [Anaerolineales bacterium]
MRRISFPPLLGRAFVLLGLLAAILSPRPLFGWLNLERARRLEAAGQPAAAAYAAAAERLPWETGLWERAALAAAADGDALTAETYFARAERQGELTPAGWLARGDLYAQRGDVASALDAWRQALPSVEAWPRLARAYRQQGDYPAAIEAWQAYLALVPADATAHYELGLLLCAVRPQEALPELLLAARLEAEYEPAAQVFRTALGPLEADAEPAYWLVVAGRSLLSLGELDLAQAALERAAILRPDYAEAWAWWGEARQQAGLDGAYQIGRALRLDRRSVLVQALAGMYWLRRGEAGRALVHYARAAAAEPSNPAWQAALGEAWEARGDLIRALASYQQATALAPDDPLYWRVLAAFCLRNATALETAALPAVERLLDLAPDDWQTHDLAGQVMTEVGYYNEAESHLRRAVELAPQQAAPYLHLGMLYLRLGNAPAAQTYLQQAVALDPGGPSGWRAQRLLEQYFP